MTESRVIPFSTPVFLFGVPEVGKTSFLLSLVDTINRAGAGLEPFRLKMEESALGYFEELEEGWRSSALDRTKADQACGFSATRSQGGPTVYFTLHDYDGASARPKSKQAKRVDDSVRAFVFMVDERNVGVDGPPKKSQAAWFASRLEAFGDANPDLHHPPIALLVNKADQIFADGEAEMALLRERPWLITEGVDRRVVAVGGPPARNLPGQPFDRLVQCVMEDAHLARSVRLQEFVWRLLADYRGFFEEVLKRTFRFQVFFSMSDGAAAKNDPERGPFGAVEPIEWLVGEMYGAYIRQGNEWLADRKQRLGEQRKALEEILKLAEQLKGAKAKTGRTDLAERDRPAAEAVEKRAQDALDKAVAAARDAKLLTAEGGPKAAVRGAFKEYDRKWNKVEELATKYAAEAERIEQSAADDYDAAGQELVRVAGGLGRLIVRLRAAVQREQPGGDRSDRAAELVTEIERRAAALREIAADLSTMGPIPLSDD